MKFESGVGFSIGVGAVGVEESAAVGAQHLDGFLRSYRTLRDGLRRVFQRMRAMCRHENSAERPAIPAAIA